MRNRSKTRVAVVGTAGVPARYGGFETLAACLSERMDPSRLDLAVYCSGHRGPGEPETYHHARLRYVPLAANGWQSIPYDIVSIAHAVLAGVDAILLLGVSGAFALPFLRLFTSVRIVTNVDGIESRRAKWGRLTRALLKVLEWLAVRYSHVVVADNRGVSDYLAETYGARSEVIAYGGDHVAPSGDEPRPPVDGDYALVIARIEPENNIDLILEAFDPAQGAVPVALVAIGNWNASEYGRALRSRYGNKPGYVLMDPVYERDAIRSYRAHAALYVHGHSAGGTNPSLVEAMFFAPPIAAFDCGFNRYTLDGLGAYFATAVQLREVVAAQSRAGKNGEDGRAVRELAWRRYTWEHIADAYVDALAGSPAPATLELGR